jgi:hypothetical protein
MLCFLASTCYHIYQMYRFKSRYFIPFVIGGLCTYCNQVTLIAKADSAIVEFIGYIGRLMSSHDDTKLSPYIMQTLLLLLAPALFAASIYMTLGRIIILTNGEEYSVIRKKWLTKIFVFGDCFSFLLQSSGTHSRPPVQPIPH